MGDILDKFIENAKQSVADGYYSTTDQIGKQATKISLAEKLRKQEFSLISEIKHASPAGEYSFDNIDAKKTAQLFKDAGADAISVVVEPKIFKGKLDNIPDAKCAGLPVLFKDFVLDNQQIKAAASLGADVILLVVKVADRVGFDMNDMIKKAHSHGLEVLLECYNANEMKRALETNADILGINNRDLRTLTVDINVTKRIIDEVGKIDRPLVSESGIRTRGDAEFVKYAGAKGILVGTSIWKAKNMQTKIHELRLVNNR
ncbi:indole-3-glycerol-phosphate synthase [Candidatus Micrarchaeota archaeon]|nr:indole-3-glycerol-phosphate synthase [Candidatus Micrarchaeota archaeon]MBU1166294.1 indole-3-glycerol-phosphate synthase [Candidatus Micrarchaeota archaeon]MBU1886396.1 indole-3-glycerol-phosphate synthase [Candidatus Micrarchaeota archaeon]